MVQVVSNIFIPVLAALLTVFVIPLLQKYGNVKNIEIVTSTATTIAEALEQLKKTDSSVTNEQLASMALQRLDEALTTYNIRLTTENMIYYIESAVHRLPSTNT